MINKYSDFLNEEHDHQPDHLEKHKDELVEELDKIIGSITNIITWKHNQVFYKDDFENIDVEEILHNINERIGEKTVIFFNVEAFLRKIHQILDLRQKSTKRNIKDEFIEYCISLDKRVETLTGEDDDEPSDYEKRKIEWEGTKEKSLISRDVYEKEKYDIQIELLKLQRWVQENGESIAIVFEGRDAAGKGSTIKRFIEHLDPKGYRIVALGIPTEEEKENWFERYEKYLPKPGEIVFFDRSWYNRAVVDPAMGYCTEEQYHEFMNSVVEWEENLIKNGMTLIKFWFSITKEKQQKRFELRLKSPLKYWKFSPNDAKVVSKWDLISFYKNQTFNNTSTTKSPWVVINSNDKKIARLNAMRYVLNVADYPDKDEDVIRYYPEVINILK